MLIESVLQERIQLCNNCLVCTEVLSFLETADGKRSDVGRHVFEHFQLDGSYRINTDAYNSHTAAASSTVSASAYSRHAGIATMFAQGVKDHGFGRIDNRHDPIVTLNAYDVFLLENPRRTSVSIIPYLLAYVDEWSVEHNDHLLTIRVPHRFAIGVEKSKSGFYEVQLDSRKAFAPTYIVEEWGEVSKKQGNWRKVTYDVSKDAWIDRVNMPMQFTRTANGSALGDGVTAVSELKVSKIEFGNVTEDDVKVIFPPGTEVIDALKGTTYFVGRDGSRLQEGSLHHSLAESTTEAASQTSNWNWKGIAVISNVVVVLLLALMVWRRSSHWSGA